MTTFTFCSTFSRCHFGWIWQRHCSQRANAMRFHTNSDGFRHSRCMLNSTSHVVQWCIGMLPDTPRFRVATLFQKSIDLLQSFLIAQTQNVVAHLHAWSWTKNDAHAIHAIHETRLRLPLCHTLPFTSQHEHVRTGKLSSTKIVLSP